MYHLGASLKDLGNKVFAFSKMDAELLNIMEKLN
ncbi:MAG: ORF6N domain-containing protein, partial [Sulfurimonas sp.]|nr:ORF6N domain-containing protein [Sulfurimonas sp.]